MIRAGHAIAGLGLLALCACAIPAMAPPEPTLGNIQAVRAAQMGPVAVGEFVLAPGRPAGMDRYVVVRASSLSAPNGKSFARYLGETLAAELRAGGKLDAASDVVISGLLTESSVSSNLPNGHAALGATFKVTRGGQILYEKPLRVEDTWTSSFMGVEAIPDAMNHYNALYAALVRDLLTDKEFAAAVRAR